MGVTLQSNNIIHTVSGHAEGEVGDVITAGVPTLPGDTLQQQRAWISADNSLRNFILNEPRGGVFRHVNLSVPPTDLISDAAQIIMESEDTPPMSGSNYICVTTVLLETGTLPMQEPVTYLTLQTPDGLVGIRAECAQGKVAKVTVENLPNFASQLDATLEVSGLGGLQGFTAFGGDSFVIVDAEDLEFKILPEEAHHIVGLGPLRITKAQMTRWAFTIHYNPIGSIFRFARFPALCIKKVRIYLDYMQYLFSLEKLIAPHVVQAYVPVWQFYMQRDKCRLVINLSAAR